MRYPREHNDAPRSQGRRSNHSGHEQDERKRRSATSRPEYQSRPLRRTTLPFPEEERERRGARRSRSAQSNRQARGYEAMEPQRSRRPQRGDNRDDGRRSEQRSSRARRSEQERMPQQARSSRRERSAKEFDPFEPQTVPRSQERSSNGARRRARHPEPIGAENSTSRARRGQTRQNDGAVNYARSAARYARPPHSHDSNREQERSVHSGGSGRASGAPRATNYGRDRYVRQSGQDGASSSKFPGRASNSQPANPTHVIGLAAVAALLLIVLVIRFIVFGGTASDYGAVRAQIDQENEQTFELEVENNELQGEIDSMQGLIEQYNKTNK